MTNKKHKKQQLVHDNLLTFTYLYSVLSILQSNLCENYKCVQRTNFSSFATKLKIFRLMYGRISAYLNVPLLGLSVTCGKISNYCLVIKEGRYVGQTAKVWPKKCWNQSKTPCNFFFVFFNNHNNKLTIVSKDWVWLYNNVLVLIFFSTYIYCTACR